MLQVIRDHITGVVAIVVLGFLAIPFVFFGIESYTRPVPEDAVARVNGESITATEFQTSFANYRRQMRERMGDAYDEQGFNQPVVRRQHLESMIDEELLRQYAEEAGLDVSRSALAEVIRSIPNFQVGGQFDQEVYSRFLRSRAQSPRQFENELRRDMLLRELPTALSSSAIVTDTEVDLMLRVQKEIRAVAYVEVPAEPFREEIEITDEAVADYYEENAGDFMTQEQVAIEYIELDAEALVPDTDIGEDELRQRYEAASARYMTPERRRAAHILLSTGPERDAAQAQARAAELAERIEAGEDFDELAREYSDDPGSAADGGDLGWIEPGVMVRAFEDAVYAMEPGDISDPVETGFGWHVIRLDEVRPPRGQSFEEAREEILDEYREDQAERLFFEVSERLVDLVYADPTTLEPIAHELGLPIQRAGPFSRFGGADPVTGNRRVIEAAFSDLVLVDGNTSDPIDIERNHIVVLRVTEHRPAAVRPLEDMEDEIRQRLVRERASEMAREQAEAMLASLRDEGADLAELAADAELEVSEREALTRRDFDVGSNLVNALFRLPAPADGPEWHVVERGGNWVLVRLDSVTPGDPAEAEDAERQRIQRQLQFGHSAYEVTGLLAHLRAHATIRVEEDRLTRTTDLY